MKKLVLAFLIVLLATPCFAQYHRCSDEVHLYIVSGQSNAKRMPIKYFTDAISKELGTNHYIVVKHAVDGMAIKWWDKQKDGRIYNTLMRKVKTAIMEKDIEDVTFIWMQGEADTMYNRIDDYLVSFDNLYNQLRHDLCRDDLRMIIGRINDYAHYKNWQAMRHLQDTVIPAIYPNTTWVNTDDLNGPWNDMHNIYGWRTLGERYADIILEQYCEGD